MNRIGKSELTTQKRVIKLFQDELDYDYLGDWEERDGNSNIEEELLSAFLTRSGYDEQKIGRAIYLIRQEADNFQRGLYGNNQRVYEFLRFGVPVKVEADEVTETVQLINWDNPLANDFAIAEEVTLHGNHTRRPDLVLYINGIAIGVIELKNSRVSIGDGIRQLLSNQEPEFNEWFFSTVQLVFAGSDTEGLKYGTIKTEEKYFLKWKEDEQDNSRYKLDKYLLKMCNKQRLLDLIFNFVLFDAGVKKVPRAHQFFGIKAAQEHADRREGGIIWHTQGSGKSIVMVMLAKWILENKPNARVVVITDREALDEQIEGVFQGAGETIHRTKSGRDLMGRLGEAKPRLLCSLVHKFGPKKKKGDKKEDNKSFEKFIQDIESVPSKTVGDVFVFVDECHRTQSGKLHRVMKAIMPDATFIGFTGTPLLKKDKATSLETFGKYIHTYKFSEAVEDEVILDLIYEARDVDQSLGSQDRIDAWFDAKTAALNDWQKAALREKWATMQNVLSSRSRMERIVSDIVFDFSVKRRLNDDRGTAILVASSIYEACKYFELFQKTAFKGKSAIITSYNPMTRDVTTENTGANTETDKEFIYNTYTELLEDIEPTPKKSKTETYEDTAKSKFKDEPANMKLLIVVDKLLTGFDAPSCTYLYIDKSMQDHGLFQAICRTNRLDGEDKDFGFIVDYMDLFKKVEKAISVYSSELDHPDGDNVDSDVLMKARLETGKERLDNALEALAVLCEPVEQPRTELQHIHYFCGNTEIPDDLKQREPQRVALYKGTAKVVRAFANIADELEAAGYSTAEVARIKVGMNGFVKLRETIKQASGETIDLKAYEADMRHLIDRYIDADEPRVISPFDDLTLLEIIVKTGIDKAVETLPEGIQNNQNSVAETIENNVRSKIIKEQLNDPAYYERMSLQLQELIAARKAKAISYEKYLAKVAALAKSVESGHGKETPSALTTKGMRAIYNNLVAAFVPQSISSVAEQVGEAKGDYRLGTGLSESAALEMTIRIDKTVKQVRPDDWRGETSKENVIKAALLGILQEVDEVERIFQIIFAQKEY